MHNFKELRIWKESMSLAKVVYELTKQFPKEELYCLTQQVNRSCISIPSNIAEGAGRNTKKDFKQFIAIALGSAFELETQLIVAGELNNISKKDLNPILENLVCLQKMTNKFQMTLA